MNPITTRCSNRLIIIYLLLVAGLAACASDKQMTSDLRSANAELAEARKQRDMFRAKVESLYDELERSRNQCLNRYYAARDENARLEERLRQCRRDQASVRTLEERNAELRRWSNALVEGYGPSIWVARDGRPYYDRSPKNASVAGIIDELNSGFRSRGLPLLVLDKVDSGIAHVNVTEGRRLSTAMGSSGAAEYLLETLYSLASLPEIDCVNFDFEEGDHATPGKQCR